ncbi:MAG: PIN domain-containing protein [Sphingopyxis sp.]
MFHAMLDTNVCIRVIRDKPQASRARFIAETGNLAISTVVLHELHEGVLRSYASERHGIELDEFLLNVKVLDFDRDAAIHAAEIKADLLKRRCVIGPNDLLIAGHARSLGLRLITGNLGEFNRVAGLHCEDWL